MKCLSIDLDGTTLTDEKNVSKETIHAIKKAKAAGVMVLLNTGRTLDTVIEIEGLKELNVPIICCNGCEIYDEKRNLLKQHTLPYETYKKIMNELDRNSLYIATYTEIGHFFNRTDVTEDWISVEWVKRSITEEMFMMQNKISSLEGVKIFKTIVVTPDDALLNQAKKTLRKIPDISTGSSYVDNVEITDLHADKGKAVLTYAKIKGLEFEEIYAIGDGGNDLSQFEIATTSIAMGNAPDELKEKADFVTKTNKENGVAYAIENILKLI